MRHILRRHQADIDDARKHLEESQAEGLAVKQLAAELRREVRENHFAERVRDAFGGRA